MGGATASVWILAAYNLSHRTLYLTYQELLGSRALIMERDVIGVILNSIAAHSFSLLVFPFTVLFLALVERAVRTTPRWLGFLGEISYSSYMLHFPLQLCFLFLIIAFGVDRAVFSSPWLLLVFFAVLISISSLSYRRFELPVQRYLRTRFMPQLKQAKKPVE